MINNENLLFNSKFILSEIKELTLSKDEWNQEIERFDVPIYIYPGQTITMIERSDEGYIIYISATTNSPNLKLRFITDDFIIEGSPKELVESGLINVNHRTFWIPYYSDNEKKYVAQLTPIPYIKYNEKFSIDLINPTKNELIVAVGTVYRYVKKR